MIFFGPFGAGGAGGRELMGCVLGREVYPTGKFQ